MSAEVSRPDPVIGTGQRVMMLQAATLANRLSDFATVAAALFRAVAAGIDPNRLQSQRRRTREFVTVVKTLESSNEDLIIEYSELIPSKVWSSGKAQISVPEDLSDRLDQLLNDIEAGSANPADLATEATQMSDLAETFHRDGRQQLLEATVRATEY